MQKTQSIFVAKNKSSSDESMDNTVKTDEIQPVDESPKVEGEDYSVVNTKVSKDNLVKDGWVQQTKEPFLDVDGKSKLIFQKNSFYKFLEVSA